MDSTVIIICILGFAIVIFNKANSISPEIHETMNTVLNFIKYCDDTVAASEKKRLRVLLFRLIELDKSDHKDLVIIKMEVDAVMFEITTIMEDIALRPS